MRYTVINGQMVDQDGVAWSEAEIVAICEAEQAHITAADAIRSFALFWHALDA